MKHQTRLHDIEWSRRSSGDTAGGRTDARARETIELVAATPLLHAVLAPLVKRELNESEWYFTQDRRTKAAIEVVRDTEWMIVAVVRRCWYDRSSRWRDARSWMCHGGRSDECPEAFPTRSIEAGLDLLFDILGWYANQAGDDFGATRR